MQQVVRAMQEHGKLGEAPRKVFDVAIVDNAHLVSELQTALVFDQLRPAKLVLIGDSNLPGKSASSSKMPFSHELMFNRSTFERLVHGDGGFCVLNNQMRLGRVLLEAVQ